MSRASALALIACLGLGVTGAPAQPPPPAADASTDPPRARIDAFRADLDQAETTLASRDLSDADLQRMRERVDPALVTLRDMLNNLAPKADALKARLDQLGPKPDDKAPPESADVARERDEAAEGICRGDGDAAHRPLLQVQAEQLTTTIADRRRALFASQLFERSSGLLSPDLWRAVARSRRATWRRCAPSPAIGCPAPRRGSANSASWR
jgi:small-conductance mechanosensitive channel